MSITTGFYLERSLSTLASPRLKLTTVDELPIPDLVTSFFIPP
jgi:hypothetical protein